VKLQHRWPREEVLKPDVRVKLIVDILKLVVSEVVA
jgi:hypothetical protein